MKYKVTDSFLSYTVPHADPTKVVSGQFKRDEFVTDTQLAKAGFDVEFLVKNESIAKVEGQDKEPQKADPKLFGKPLSFYAGKSDADIVALKDVGEPGLKIIRDAQAEAAK